jgi:hypothetical protein
LQAALEGHQYEAHFVKMSALIEDCVTRMSKERSPGLARGKTSPARERSRMRGTGYGRARGRRLAGHPEGILPERRREAEVAGIRHVVDTRILAASRGNGFKVHLVERLFEELQIQYDRPRPLENPFTAGEIGTVDASFLMTIDSAATPGTFTPAGRAWQILEIDWARGVCAVKPVPAGPVVRDDGAEQPRRRVTAAGRSSPSRAPPWSACQCLP